MGDPALVQHQGVKLVARLKAAHLAEEAAPAQGSHVEDLLHGQWLQAVPCEAAPQLGYLDGLRHGPEDGEDGAAGDVGAQAHAHVLVQEEAHRRGPGGQVGVGLGAVGDVHALLPHPLHLLAGTVDAVGHDGGNLPAEEAEVVVGVPVELGPGGQLPHPGDLLWILREMGLDGETVLPLDLP